MSQYLLLTDGKKSGVFSRLGLMHEAEIELKNPMRDLPDHGKWLSKSGRSYEWFKLAE